MNITLYNNKAENIRVDKSEYLDNALQLTGSLREGTSLTSPSILIEKTDLNLFSYNYVYIQDFNRYYFITDIISENTYLWRINCKVDVLMSFKTQILAIQNPYISRSASQYDLNIGDDQLYLKNNVNVVVTPYSNDLFRPKAQQTGFNYVLSVMNNQEVSE